MRIDYQTLMIKHEKKERGDLIMDTPPHTSLNHLGELSKDRAVSRVNRTGEQVNVIPYYW